MNKKICILTATRAEYGLLKPVIKKLRLDKSFDARLAVTGAHLSEDFGMTWQEIEQDKIPIEIKIDILTAENTKAGTSVEMANALIKFTDYFQTSRPDMLLLLGDRYETLAVAISAMNLNIPIIHLYGGETSEGAADEGIRHAITKLSYLHLTSTESYRQRVIQLGESPDRVFTVGALGVENILNESLISKKELENKLEFYLDMPYGLVTFHPVTLEDDYAENQINELLMACEEQKNMKYIFTRANADANGKKINRIIEKFTKKHNRMILVSSLGMINYLSAMKYCTLVMGNSSSGIIEAPSFKVPTINIGDRQRGRIQAESVINCLPIKEDIIKSMNKALSTEFQNSLENVVNPYGNQDTSDKIVSIIKEIMIIKTVNLKKKFYDCGVDRN
jgi:GDP/UDP-N,N'-diacetylbacillosamine 2-epimerase (hydrolysing)